MKFEKVYNVRTVKCAGMNDMLIRSGRLMFSAEQDIRTLKEEIKMVVDFRGSSEQHEFPNPAGMKEFNAMSDQTKKDVQPLITARAEYMAISLNEIEKLGGIEAYCLNQLKLTENEIASIRTNLKA